MLAAALLALLLGCSGPPPAPAPGADVVADALKAFEASDWVPAARLLREAIVKEPANVTLHYYLAISATHLQLRDEAVREFQWVVANAPASSAEAQAARKWLTDAGVFASAQATAEATAPAADTGTDSGVRGRVTWDPADTSVSTRRLQLFLKGLPNSPTQDEYYVLRTDEQGNYHFRKVAPGGYKLTNRIAGKPEWRLRVAVAPGQQLAVDLNPSNSTRARDDFPQDDK